MNDLQNSDYIKFTEVIQEMLGVLDALVHGGAGPAPGSLPTEVWQNQSFRKLCNDILSMREAKDQLYDMAHTDQLTGLPNRWTLEAFLARSFQEAKTQNRCLCILMIDLDGFKQINDTHGHHAGDLILAESADTMREAFRQSDLFARYGGDEFIAVLPKSSYKGGQLAAERLRTLLKERSFGGDLQLQMTVSIGVALLQPQDSDPMEIKKRGDVAVYQAKKKGGDRVCVWK